MGKLLYPALLALLCAQAGLAQNLSIQTLAGGGVPGGGTQQNIAATSASLGLVSGVAVYGGSVYIALQTYSSVVRMDASGTLTLVAGNGTPGFSGDGGPATSAQLNVPWGIAADPRNGDLYIADSGNNRIRKVSNGVITTLVGGGTISLSSPTGVAVDGSGNVYIADSGNNVVRKWSNGVTTIAAGALSGGVVQVSGSATGTTLALSAALPGSPTGIAVDASGNLYIADFGFDAIRKVTNGALTTPFFQQATATTPGVSPTSVAVDAAGNIFFTSLNFNVVGEFTAAGAASIFAGNTNFGYTGDGGTATSSTLQTPSGVAVDGSGNVYIADFNNYAVRKVAVGVINTVAGSTQGYDGDGGFATNALLFDPTYTATGPAGELYIVDSAHNSVRKVLNGIITTVAGTGYPGYSGDNGLATSAQLNAPFGVAVDHSGSLYISDSNNHVIRKVSGGVITTIAGIGGSFGYTCDNCSATASDLYYPSGVALDAAGNLYIADYGNNRVREVSNGTITTVAGSATQGYNGDGIAPTSAALFNPSDVKFDASGNLYIADQGNNLIRVVSGGVINTIAGLASNASAGAPGGFGGDGGPATSALLNGPSGIAFDAAGALYIADTNNNVIRRVASGIINTIAGNGAAAYAGDSGPPTSASLNGPAGVSIGPAGQIYIADSGNNLIRATNQSCNYSVTPTSVPATAAGGAFNVNVQTGSLCSWSISGLPVWATVSGALSNVGSATVNLTIAPDPGAARNATIVVAGVSIALTQAACTYAISPGGQVFPASGGTGSITVTTASACSWTVTNTNSWITFTGTPGSTGSGTISFTAAPSAAGRTGSFTVAGQTFVVDEQASSIPGMSLIGSMPHIAAEENWITTFTMVNTSSSSNQVRLNLFGSDIDASGDGSPLLLPLSFPQQPGAGLVLGASVDNTLAPSASWVVSTAGQGITPVVTGSAQVGATAALGGFAIFHRISDNQEAVVPLTPGTPNASSYLLAYDNTGGISTAVALANVSAQAASRIAYIIRDDTGTQIGQGTLSLPGNGQTSFNLPTSGQGFAPTIGKRGTVEFDTPTGGQISVLGIRNTPQTGGATTLTTVPALAGVGTGGGSFAFIASGGDGWQTTFVLVNTGSTAAPATLKFFDPSGNPLALQYVLPQTSNTINVASAITQPLAVGATLLIQSSGTPNLVTGSAQLTTTGKVSGFVIFRHNGQEAVVPIESRNASAYVLAFDNTNNTGTGIALNNVTSSSQPVSIPVVIRDDAGNPIRSDTLTFAANGDDSFVLNANYTETVNIRGTIEFDAPSGVQIGALGIRTPPAQTYTSLPALTK